MTLNVPALTLAEAKRRAGRLLLTRPESNTKVAKGLKIGVMTAPLHLAPADLSGFEVCPMRSAGCSAACLNTAGRGRFDSTQNARIEKTRLYFEDRALFLALLIAEIAALSRKARAANMTPAVRLNATSDIPFERVRFVYNDHATTIFDLFPEVTFYDYTKRANRFDRPLPANYSLTFSMAEDNDADALRVLRNGGTVAVVFDTAKSQALPRWFQFTDGHGHSVHPTPVTKLDLFPVIDGDVNDYRPADPKATVIGLRAKGDARNDETGFVRAAPDTKDIAA